MWLAQIFARCPVLLQFRHTTSADTLHFPWKNTSASSFFGEALFGRWFLAWLLFCAFWVFRFTAYALSLLCSSHLFLPELRASAMCYEDHGHDLLLCDIIEVTLIRDVQDSVGVLDHALPLFLREFEQLHSSCIQGVSLRNPVGDDVHT